MIIRLQSRQIIHYDIGFEDQNFMLFMIAHLLLVDPCFTIHLRQREYRWLNHIGDVGDECIY